MTQASTERREQALANLPLVREVDRLRKEVAFLRQDGKRKGRYYRQLQTECAWPGCRDEAHKVGHCRKHVGYVLDELGAVKVAHSHVEYLERLNAENVSLMRENAELKRRLLGEAYRATTRNPFVARTEANTVVGCEEPPTPKRPTDGVVYALRVGGFIKIGWASDLDKRMRQYPPDTTLLAVMPGTRADEKKAHKRLATHRAHGREWFAMTPPVMEWVQSVVRDHGQPDQPDWSAKPVKVPRPHSTARPFTASKYGSGQTVRHVA